ncbi:MAG TPA: hypothetical protein PKW55_00135 [Spirochaetota bacterium]|mgnify:CR=1 FL=1|nr:hypothetical protein [Spirochaetota bacterium]HOM37766.1 hypothetical protein [Spirochaetota bacterium]HPQ49357.1 hypothetical protein [Spirochaetota bacterium]
MEKNKENLLIVIPEQKLLNTITSVLIDEGLSVLPFLSFSVIPQSILEKIDIFIWDIEAIDIYSNEYINKIKNRDRIKFILTDFLNDDFISKIIEKNKEKDFYKNSYKLRDLIFMINTLRDEDKLTKIDTYLNPPAKIFTKKLKESDNYIEEAQKILLEFLKTNNLDKNIDDIDIFMISVGELVENFVENHMIRKKIKPEIVIDYGFDNEKLIIGVRDFFGDAELAGLFSSFIRKVKEKTNENKLTVYSGPRGRGIMIMKKGFDRIISVVKRNSKEKLTEFITIIYFNKLRENKNSSINMLVFT